MENERSRVTLAHGNGGRRMRELIEAHLAPRLENPTLDITADAVPLDLPDGRPVITTDGFTVQPLEFPGGSIGSLSVHGTINDLAVAGADPLVLTLSLFIEEGFELGTLDRIVADAGRAARDASTRIAAGDTKVVPRGQGGGLYIASTGLGVLRHPTPLGVAHIRSGDAVIVSGPVGDHAITVLLAREEFGMRSDLKSDSASVLPLTRALRDVPGTRFMRDPTRGGIATAGHEIARATGLGVTLDEAAIPVRPAVRAVCDMLGYDPFYLACEGRVVAVVEAGQAEAALAAWHSLPEGREAAVVGRIGDASAPVALRTPIGGTRVLEELEDDPLPRIC